MIFILSDVLRVVDAAVNLSCQFAPGRHQPGQQCVLRRIVDGSQTERNAGFLPVEPTGTTPTACGMLLLFFTGERGDDIENTSIYTGIIGIVWRESVVGLAPLRTQRMGKGMTIAGMVIAVLLLILFTLDLVIGIPFNRASKPMDIMFVISALGLGFLSWSTMKDFD